MTLFSAHFPHISWKLMQVHLEWIMLRKGLNAPRQQVRSPHYVALWVRKGHVAIQVNRQRVEAENGEWLFRQPASCHYEYGKDTEVLWVAFSIRWVGDGHLLLPPEEKVLKLGALPELEEKTVRLYHTIQRNIDNTEKEDLRFDSLPWLDTNLETYLDYHYYFLDWLRTWEREHRRHGLGMIHALNVEDKVVSAVRYMEEMALDEPLLVKVLAKGLGLSSSHLTHLFHQQYGMAPKAYWMQMRLRQAITQLTTTSDEIKEIATRFGYSPTWFGMWIKQETGKTPRQLRREGGAGCLKPNDQI